MKHPLQKVHLDKNDTFRFVQNEIVCFMVEKLKEFGFDLNDLHANCNASSDDWDQFNQLIGYSVSGIPARNSDVCDIPYQLMNEDGTLKGDDPNTLSFNFYEKRLNDLKKQLAEPMAELFDIHPADLFDADQD